jgi:hypothetical protein
MGQGLCGKPRATGGYMESWEQQLDVVNCATHFEDIFRENTYICPVDGKAYRHKRSKYFGLYRNKKVELVANIDAVVDVYADRSEVIFKNVDVPNESIIGTARTRVQQLRPNETTKRVFLLSGCYATEFVKDTPGGMFSSKQYFDVSTLNVADSMDLAQKLNGKSWSEV